VMVLVISPDSVASDQVKHEWQYYQDLKKPIIPVIYRPAKVQFQLSRVQYIDFSRQQYLSALGQLCVELQARGVRLSGPLPQPPKPASSTRRGGRIGCLVKSLLRAAVLVAVIGVVVFVVLTLGSPSEEKSPPTTEPHPPDNNQQENVLYRENDDPRDVVRFYFEALETKNLDLIGALICADPKNFEYDKLFGNRTFTVRNVAIGELEEPTMRSVRVHFTFTLVARNQNGEVQEFNQEPFFFDIRRRDPDMPDSPWCSDTPELPMVW
jgi:hypothetical protein